MTFFSFHSYVIDQTRIGTSLGMWLDLVSRDFFYDRLPRRSDEPDLSFRQRILSEIEKDRCTRRAVAHAVSNATGQGAWIFEPGNLSDTGCYGGLQSPAQTGLGYQTAGGWGSLSLPFQTFMRVVRPVPRGISNTNGWSISQGSYGGGLSAYADINFDSGLTRDGDLTAAINRARPAGSLIWLSIE